MAAIDGLIEELSELSIARNVAIAHDEARANYRLASNTVGSFDEFTDIITDYYNYHASRCVMHGGYLSHSEASSRAKDIIEQEYRSQGGNLVTAYEDAHEGTGGGMRVVLDRIAEGIKAQSVGNYIRHVFDRYVQPPSWPDKVEIMRQFLQRYGRQLSRSIRIDEPERYAQNYQELVRSYVDALRRTSSAFRRF